MSCMSALVFPVPLCAGIHCSAAQTQGGLFLLFSEGVCQWKGTKMATWGIVELHKQHLGTPPPRETLPHTKLEVHLKPTAVRTRGNNQF